MCGLSSSLMFTLILFLVIFSFLLTAAITMGFVYMKNYRGDIVKKTRSSFVILSFLFVAIIVTFIVVNVVMQGFSLQTSDIKLQ